MPILKWNQTVMYVFFFCVLVLQVPQFSGKNLHHEEMQPWQVLYYLF